MQWRTRRQAAVIGIMLAIAGGVGFLGWRYFTPVPTCTDKKQNQGEFGVDCGGPCEPCALKNPKTVAAYWARAIPVRENVYDVAAEIYNPNEVLSSPRFEYTFELFDDSGLVGRVEGSTFLYAQERALIVEANVKTARAPTRTSFTVRSAGWKYSADAAPRPNIVVERRQYIVVEELGKKQSVVDAQIVNNTPYDFRETEVLFAITDGAGNVIGVNRIVIDRFLSGTSRSVRSLWPGVLAGDAARVDVEPRVNIFAPGAILIPSP